MRARTIPYVLTATITLAAGGRVDAETRSFHAFESGQVRPLALSPSRKLLYAVNTPDSRLEIFQVTATGLVHARSVQVGLEPVAVAARTEDEVWVVNHLSDSVSVIKIEDLGQAPDLKVRVERTLLVGDEPRDLVFAGPNRRRAFITAAHRGQNVPFDPQFFTPGVGRADVWVFDAQNLGAGLGGTPLTILALFTDTPRALAVTPDGATVYAAGFLTGNKTTSFIELLLDESQRIGPLTNHAGVAQPKVGLILHHDGAHWVDVLGRVWDHVVNFRLPDKDVFAIDAMANPPAQKAGEAGWFAGVGTVLYNMAVNPASGRVYVSNTDARNMVRFEGPGVFGPSTVRGHHNENRITVLRPSGAPRVAPRHLNKHIDYGRCCDPLPNDENERSLAIPTGMAVSSDGSTLYVAALGSSKIGVFDTGQIEDDSFVPDPAAHIALSGGGPTGLVLDEQRGRLYAMTRFDNSVAVVDLASRAEVSKVALYSPEPPSVTEGRPFLYDAKLSSSRGDSACATCHVFGDLDALSWDLGNPDGDPLPNLNPILPGFFGFADPVDPSFQPMKGPLSTQSLRGMANHGPMHWRGDRNGALEAPTAQPDGGAYDEHAAFLKFNPAFVGLLGRHEQLPAADMQKFATFILQVMYPPNPVRALDNSLTERQAAGRDHYMNAVGKTGTDRCNDCHVLDPSGNAEYGVALPGFFGTAGDSARSPFPQVFKVPHLRNMYQKVGMFGSFSPELVFDPIPGHMGHLGDQIRGFGVSRAGDIDSLLRFVSNFANLARFPFHPNPGGLPSGEDMSLKLGLAEFMLAFPSNLAPIVGQQVTFSSSSSSAAVQDRIALLKARAVAGECELVAKLTKSDGERGFLHFAGMYLTDSQHEPPLGEAALQGRALAPRASLTYTCAPPGAGRRLGIDRDLDDVLDADE
jgi:DNA-binding beta-propeller fold protein YncE